MPVKIFKGNPRNTGSVMTFNFGPSEKGGELGGEISLYLNILLQASWNEATKRPSFKENANDPTKKLTIKFSEFETGALINAFKRRVEFKAYHTHVGKSGHTQLSVTPSTKDNVFQGFQISALRDGVTYRGTVSPGEAENLLCLFDMGLKTLYTTRHRTQFDGFVKKQTANTPAKPAAKPAPAPQPQEVDAFDMDGQTPPEATEQAPEASDDTNDNPFG